MDGIVSSSAELILKGNFSVNLGEVQLDGDDRKIDLTAVTTKDVALVYATGDGTDSETVLLGGGDDALELLVRSQGATNVTLGAGDDTVTLRGIPGATNVAGFSATTGALKAVTRITDFGDDDTLVVDAGVYEALAAGAFTGVAETDSAYFAVAKAAVADGAFVANTYTVFDAADGSGVYIYSAGAVVADTDDFYVKLVGVSMDDLDIDGNTITHG